MNDIPDEIVNQVLADPNARQAIEQLLKANNIDQPIEELSADMKKAAAAALINAQQRQPAQPAPDETLDQVLQDPQAIEQINAMLKANNAPSTFEEMDREQQKAILGEIISQQQQGQQQQGGGIQVDLGALGLDEPAFDQIWQDALKQADGDVVKFSSILQAKLVEAGAPMGAITQLVDQLPKPNGAA